MEGVASKGPGQVEITGLTWRPFGAAHPVLADLSLSIPAGQRVLIVGPSGCGKSTLLRAIAGVLLSADAGDLQGDVLIDGQAAGSGQIGLVQQEPGASLVAHEVGADVAFGLENHEVPPAAMPDIVAASLAQAGLHLPLSTPTSTLSGGETQRLALAGALALDPSVLLLDEVTAMLNESTAQQVLSATAEATAGLTTIIVEHRFGPWLPVVDRLIAMGSSGQIVLDIPSDEVVQHAQILLELDLWVPGTSDPEPKALPDQWGHALGGPSGRQAELRSQDLVIAGRTVHPDGWESSTDILHLPGEFSPAGGALTAVIGPSGSGKSTLLSALSGAISPARGEVFLAGEPAGQWSSQDAAPMLGWAPQWSRSTVVARTCVEEMLTTSRALGRITSANEGAERERSLRWLNHVGLAEKAEVDPAHLSGGQLRRLSVAAALFHRPAFVLADEPTVGQDRAGWAALVGLFVGSPNSPDQSQPGDGGPGDGGSVAGLPGDGLSEVDALGDGVPGVIAATHDSALRSLAASTVQINPVPRPEPMERPAPLLARCGPLSLFAGSMGGTIAAMVCATWQQALLVLALTCVLGLLGMQIWTRGGRSSEPLATNDAGGTSYRSVRYRRLAARLAFVLLAALTVGWSNFLLSPQRSLDQGALAGLRILLLVVPSAFTLPFVRPDEIASHLAQFMRLPRRLASALAAALERIASLQSGWRALLNARRIRGLRPGRSPLAQARWYGGLTFALLVRALDEASTLAVAMDARGFARAHHRTFYLRARWRPLDTIVVVAGLLPALLAIALRA